MEPKGEVRAGEVLLQPLAESGSDASSVTPKTASAQSCVDYMRGVVWNQVIVQVLKLVGFHEGVSGCVTI